MNDLIKVRVDSVSCEGYAFRSYICPVEAIEMEEKAGELTDEQNSDWIIVDAPRVWAV